MQPVQDNEKPAALPARRMRRLPLLLATLAAAGAAVTQQARSDVPYTRDSLKATTYHVVNLADGLLATIPDINAKGQVSFSLESPGGATGYFYNGAALQNIGTLGGGEVLAVDLNDVGQIAGRSTTASGSQHAFVWSAGGGMLDLGVLPGASQSEAEAINNEGVVTGSSSGIPLLPPRAFRWSATTGMENLGALTSDLSSASFGSALNDAGLIAGSSDLASGSGRRHAFAWTRTGGINDIDTLNSYDALVIAVGAKGEVAGNHIATTDYLYSPFLWTAATGMVDLGKGGGTEAFVLAMTPDVQIAGLIDTTDGNQRAMYWTRTGGMRNLGTLGGPSSRAIDVNVPGQVVGYAQNAAGADRGFVWTAKRGMLDLNNYLRDAPPGLVIDDALAINDSGAIVASSNAGLVLLRPDKSCKTGCKSGHVLGPVVAPALVKAGASVQASVAFVDADRVGTRSVSWSWGDGSAAQAGKVNESGSAGNASASHSFAAPGIYTITATAVDRSGASTSVSRQLVVTGAAGGALAGTGMVTSPAGALAKVPSYAGKARFSLLAPVTAGAGAQGVPASLRFDMPGLNFRSQDVRPLGRQGDQYVFEGSGTVHGKAGYQFRLATSATASAAASANGQNRFVLKIWHADPASKRDVVDYDNARAVSGTPAARVAAGMIVVQ